MTLISDPISPLGVAGSNVTVICTAELSSAIDVPVDMQVQLTDPDGHSLATVETPSRSLSTANYTSRALINSFRRDQAGLYTCTVSLSSPRLQERVTSRAINIHVGKNVIFDKY